MALIPVDDDVWLREADACERLCTEINGQIADRNREARNSERWQQISATIRVRLNQFNSQVKELRTKLDVIRGSLTREEAERRVRQVEILESRRIRLQSEFMDLGAVDRDRSELVGGPSSVWQEGTGQNQSEGLKNYSTDQLVEQRKKILAEQEEGLENLSKIISRQKEIAVKIHEEVENQNELLDDIGNGMEGVDTRIHEEIGHIRQVGGRPSYCGYYLLILGLIVLLIVVISLRA